MFRIKQLSKQEAQKIAAGEVVERPLNVVKELLENSIDANSNQIIVYIEEAGKKLIRIVDDGYGMSLEDAKISFKQHTTSKITSIKDLSSLQTFGFRGEALASICTVSKMTLTTKEAGAEQGIKLELENGECKKEDFVTCNTGTDISIADLFYNVPARKKFLKSDETEIRHIVQLFQAFCLDYKNIHFRLFSDNKLVYNCPPTNNLKDRVTQLWNYALTQNILDITIQNPEMPITITGAISNYQYSRYDKNLIFLFVNRRWIKNINLSKALLKGYSNVLPPAKFPAAFIFIDVNPEHIDINIHPKKDDVLFLYTRKIELLLQEAIKKALETKIIQEQPELEPALQPSFIEPEEVFDFDKPVFENITPIQEVKSEVQFALPQRNYDIIGQFNKTYILIEKPEGLVLIDQHAAHERILYEKFLKNFQDMPVVKLLFPQIITLSREDIRTILPHVNVFKQHGIEIEQFGETQLIIQSTPIHIKDISFEDLIKQFIGWIEDNNKEDLSKTIHEKLRAQMACKAAIKAGDTLTTSQIYNLLEDYNNTENNFSCPHGRPTSWVLSLYEIEKKFKRKL